MSIQQPQQQYLFDRAIVKIQADGDDAWHTWLSCGHETILVVWPYAPIIPCAQCVGKALEQAKQERSHDPLV